MPSGRGLEKGAAAQLCLIGPGGPSLLFFFSLFIFSACPKLKSSALWNYIECSECLECLGKASTAQTIRAWAVRGVAWGVNHRLMIV